MGLVDGRRLSWPRVGVVVVLAAGLVFGSLRGWQWFQDSRTEVTGTEWFAGYVDVTATPSHAFEDPTPGAGTSAVLSFVVADPKRGCTPSWGGAYRLDQADEDLDLARRVARLQQLGGRLVVSFGGQANEELALTCTDPDDLVAAYRSVVDRYDIGVVDLDIEGAALADTAATQRRAQAIARLQSERDTQVWLTLPVDPNGLTEEGLGVVSSMLEAGVEVSGVNAMTMNYAESKDAGDTVVEASLAALQATHSQLGDLYAGRDDRRTPAQLWRQIGMTPMIGQNDVLGEVLDLAGAQQLKDFASAKQLGRISMWSLNRDRTCSTNWPDVTKVSSSCSGLNQETGAFAQIFGAAVDNGPDEPVPSATPTTSPTSTSTAEPSDDPATSPYQVWNAEQAYQAGERVVWQHNVYAAKWWTSGDLPDDPTVVDSATPWRLIGPVLQGETPEPLPTLAAGTLPAWKSQKAYSSGARVQLGDVGYVAQWWTQGDSPDAPSTADSPSPWRRLTAREISALDSSS